MTGVSMASEIENRCMGVCRFARKCKDETVLLEEVCDEDYDCRFHAGRYSEKVDEYHD